MTKQIIRSYVLAKVEPQVSFLVTKAGGKEMITSNILNYYN